MRVLTPLQVHCSAGVGRTGALISISSLLFDVERWKRNLETGDLALPVKDVLPPIRSQLTNDPIGRTIDALRMQRVGMVQTKEQEHFIYRCVAAAWKENS